jgi:hypothetical protein
VRDDGLGSTTTVRVTAGNGPQLRVLRLWLIQGQHGKVLAMGGLGGSLHGTLALRQLRGRIAVTRVRSGEGGS